MGRGLALAVAVLTGTLVALQPPINSRLGKSVGTLPAAVISFAVGLVVLIVLAAAFDGFGKIGEARHVPLVYLTGGLLGAAYVATAILTVRTLGAGGVTAATIAGQLTMAVVVDQLGLLGVTRHPITAARVAGVVLLGLGTYLVVRR